MGRDIKKKVACFLKCACGKAIGVTVDFNCEVKEVSLMTSIFGYPVKITLRIEFCFKSIECIRI